ncbi:THAP domain-containing protein 2 [Merluccius polli]|uniref:THAP domain-containing protein 2 n=1 Tax=Merluccius polli TaxID=89951 RepID=A0AA47NSF1_MERPO|nr:THAP domain-containing protein 2 [Merluccius polli]
MAEMKSRCHCSVPLCQSNKQRQPYLSFHGFPTEVSLRKKWIKAVRRDEGPNFKIKQGSTFVCSRHFEESDYTTGSASRLALADVSNIKRLKTHIKRLKIGSVPSRFQWNNSGLPRSESAYERASTRLSHDVHPALPLEQPLPCEQEVMEDIAGALDAAFARIQQLEDDIKELTTAVTAESGSNKDILFYTRFTSRDVFCDFWEAIQPSASMVVYWSKAQKKGQTFEPISPSPTRRMQLVDEFFLFCCRVAAGLQEKVLADMFQVSVSTVSRVIITWANYLYLLLGSLPIWMSKQQVKNTTPSKFVQYSPDVRVIIDCTEVRCQNPSSLTLQSEVFSSYKNTTTLLDLLEPGDGCMADKGFTIEKLLADRGATLIIPPFKMTAQFTEEDALKKQAIARLQILVERAIRRVKEYRIWEHTLPLTLSGTVNQLWTVCCVMTNFQGPLDLKSYIPVE